MAITQLSIFLENKPGTLHETVKRISEAGVNIRAMTSAEVRDFGSLRIIVSDVEKAMAVLQDDHIITTTEVVSAVMEDKAGALYDILQAIESANVNIEYMYAFLGGEYRRKAYMIFRVTDTQKAEAALVQRGLVPLSQDDISGI